MAIEKNKKILIKTLLVILSLLQFTGCEGSSSPEDQTKYFPPELLSELHLDSVGGFWANDSITHIYDHFTAQFYMHQGHLSCLHYSSKNNNRLFVSVFETEDIALDAMKDFIHTTQAIFYPSESQGDPNCMERDEYFPVDIQQRIKDKWWWCNSWSPGWGAIFIFKWNTIIGADGRNDSTGTGVRLAEAAIEIAERVNALCEVVE